MTSAAPAPEPDADLVRRARAGDRAAFGVLVERHGPLLVRTCRRVLRSEAAAADAAQDAVLSALLSLDALRADDAFGPWLAGIGLNAARRLLRRSAREAPLDHAAEPAAAGPDPDGAADAAFVARRVRDALAGLPAGQRDAVFWFYLAGLSHAEVAQHLHTAPGAVKTRLHKARASLRDELSDVWKEHFAMADHATPAPPVPVRVAGVRLTEPDGRHVVVLEERGGERQLAIWIGDAEATALALALEGVADPRPGTHALALALLGAARAEIREVRISRLADLVFFAEIVLADGSAVDARPSDALVLAARTGARITVDAAVFAGSERAEPALGTLAEALAAGESTAAIVARRTAAREEEAGVLARLRAQVSS